MSANIGDVQPRERETRRAFLERTGLLPSGKRVHILRPDLSNVTVCGRVDFNAIPDADLDQHVHRNIGICRVCRGVADGDWHNMVGSVHSPARRRCSTPEQTPERAHHERSADAQHQ